MLVFLDFPLTSGLIYKKKDVRSSQLTLFFLHED